MIGAEHDAALYLCAEALERLFGAAARNVVARVRGAVAILYAVEAGEVGRSLGRGQNVVDRQRVLDQRQRDLEYLRAERLVRLSSRHDVLADRVRDALAEILLRQTDLEALNVCVQVCAQRTLERGLDRSGVMQRIVTGNGIEQHRSVLDGTAERTDLVEGGCERDKAVTGNRAVGRLEADNAAEGRRLTDGAAGIRAESERRFACRNNSSGAAGRAARYAVEVMRVVGRVCSGVLAGRTHCELVHVCLAGDDSVSSGQLLDDGRVVRRLAVIKHLGRAGGQRTLGADVVLDRDRDTGQSGKLLTGSALLIDGFCLCERCFLGYGNVALNLVLYRLRAGKTSFASSTAEIPFCRAVRTARTQSFNKVPCFCPLLTRQHAVLLRRRTGSPVRSARSACPACIPE